MNIRLDHDLFRLRAGHPPSAQIPLINDDLGKSIACGSVKVKDDVKRFTATGVEFTDGSLENNIDVVSVVYCLRSALIIILTDYITYIV